MSKDNESQKSATAFEQFENLLGGLVSVPKKALDQAIEALKPKHEACDEPEAEDDATK
jgi:hypothetical protein